MLSIEQCRELITNSEELTDAQIEELRKDCYGIAELAWDVWLLKKRKASKKKDKSSETLTGKV